MSLMYRDAQSADAAEMPNTGAVERYSAYAWGDSAAPAHLTARLWTGSPERDEVLLYQRSTPCCIHPDVGSLLLTLTLTKTHTGSRAL